MLPSDLGENEMTAYEEMRNEMRDSKINVRGGSVRLLKVYDIAFFFNNLIESEHLFRCSIQIKKYTASLSCVFYRISSTRKENYSLLCLSKPV